MITGSPDVSAAAQSPARRFDWDPFESAHHDHDPALIATGPDDESERIEVPIGWSTLGSSPQAQIRLAHPEVARIHARVIRDSDEILHVIDDRSHSGVYVNGERVRCAELNGGDEVVIGPYRMIVLAGERERHPVA